MSDDKISKSLGIEPTLKGDITKLAPVVKAAENNDYEYARRNLYDIIEKGSAALEDIVDVAKQSESPRAYEVLTNLLKTLAETNKDLLELAKKDKELKRDEIVPQNNTINNNLHITSADLLKLIKEKNDR
jgi:hypothetical protein